MGDLDLAEEQSVVLSGLGMIGESPTGSPQPTTGHRGSALHPMVLEQPDRALTSTDVVAPIVEEAVGTLPSLDACIEPSQPPARFGQQIEPFGLLDRAGRLNGAGRVVGCLPLVASQRLTCCDQTIGSQ
ncbi:MAG: hypothetical protein JJE52_17715 [Acidimicrobiia bacterium]|nr:hypothetical protein [Acidimicrobiia bacterium]